MMLVASLVMAVMAFAAPQPALAKGGGGGIEPQWTICHDYGCTDTICEPAWCDSPNYYVKKYKDLWCHSEGKGWYHVYLCSCQERIGSC